MIGRHKHGRRSGLARAARVAELAMLGTRRPAGAEDAVTGPRPDASRDAGAPRTRDGSRAAG